MRTPTEPLSLSNIYGECALALRDRERLIEERIDFLFSLGLLESDTAIQRLAALLLKTRSASVELKTLASAAMTELEQLRFENARLREKAE